MIFEFIKLASAHHHNDHHNRRTFDHALRVPAER